MNSAHQPQRIEINDPMDCDIYLGSSPPVPAEGEARVCGQCGHATWTKTERCMWCGFDKFTKPARIGISIALALIVAALWIRQPLG